MKEPEGVELKPNILFVMADQFRYDATGLNGGWARTPNLDGIASEGVNFRRCYTTSPVCMPARVSPGDPFCQIRLSQF